MILLWLAIGAGPWTAADEAELAPVRERFGFSEGMRPLELGSEHVRAEACGACHAQVYREWRESRHSQSAINELFVAGLEAEPQARCVRCHAPLREQAEPFVRYLRERRLGASTLAIAPDASAREGIGCAVCHVREGAVLTARPIETSEHPTRFEPLLRDARFCASCHQFRFERGRALTEHVTQDTWREWRETGEEDCRGCHMKRGSHLFPGAHDRELLARSIEVRAKGRALAIRSIGVGHRMPTGDLFRHLVVQVERQSERGREWITIARLGRRFEVVREPATERYVKRLVVDETLAPDEVRWVIAGRAERWRVLYGFTRDDRETIVIAEGTFVVQDHEQAHEHAQ
jgi:hypothetical protein